MKTPERIQPLIEEGLVDEVICQLMGGKEAMVYVVRCDKAFAVPKFIRRPTGAAFVTVLITRKAAEKKTAAALVLLAKRLEGRKARQDAWQSVEVDALYRLAAAGVPVPQPYSLFEGVLLMELIQLGKEALRPASTI